MVFWFSLTFSTVEIWLRKSSVSFVKNNCAAVSRLRFWNLASATCPTCSRMRRDLGGLGLHVRLLDEQLLATVVEFLADPDVLLVESPGLDLELLDLGLGLGDAERRIGVGEGCARSDEQCGSEGESPDPGKDGTGHFARRRASSTGLDPA